MAYAVSDHILDQPTESRVSRIYRYLGDGISGVTSALDRVGDWIDLVQSRHEELSTFGSVLRGDAESLGFIKHPVKDLSRSYQPRKN